MFTNFTKIFLFISSYSPLLLIVTLQTREDYGYWSLLPTALAIISIFGLLIVRRKINITSTRELEVSRVQQKDAEVMAYIITYIFPFIGFDFNDFNNLISIFIFFIILGIIYINSNMIHINPLLCAFRFHIYEIETSTGSNYTIVSRRKRMIKNEKLKVVKINDYLLMEKST
ncbi:hypothetical protein [Methanosarcina siciliae]|uniref:hypothetical protein n=1 Tax=Methanosarcina siciliae TaxID=38027 RepID=UPI00064F5BC2|nr:hypothetical protein [Methanosarcina siciliae]